MKWISPASCALTIQCNIEHAISTLAGCLHCFRIFHFVGNFILKVDNCYISYNVLMFVCSWTMEKNASALRWSMLLHSCQKIPNNSFYRRIKENWFIILADVLLPLCAASEDATSGLPCRRNWRILSTYRSEMFAQLLLEINYKDKLICKYRKHVLTKDMYGWEGCSRLWRWEQQGFSS